MPKDFLDCVENNGKVITKTLKDGKYIRLCKDSKGWHKGEVKQSKEE
jgi:hypothetical protein